MAKPTLPKNGEMQRCALTGEAALPSTLLCFVLDPSGQVVFDLKQNLPVEARLWLLPRRQVVQRAMAERVFTRLSAKASWPDDLDSRVGMQLRESLLGVLHLLRRSGALVGGFEKVRANVMSGQAVALFQAHDAAEDGRMKLAKLAAHYEVPVITVLDNAALASVTGRERQVHLAVSAGGLAERVVEESERLGLYFGANDADGAQ